jgi:hypothetical protein
MFDMFFGIPYLQKGRLITFIIIYRSLFLFSPFLILLDPPRSTLVSLGLAGVAGLLPSMAFGRKIDELDWILALVWLVEGKFIERMMGPVSGVFFLIVGFFARFAIIKHLIELINHEEIFRIKGTGGWTINPQPTQTL